MMGLSPFNPCEFYVRNMENKFSQFMEDVKFSWVQNVVLGLFEELDNHLSNLGLKNGKDQLAEFESWKADSNWDESKIKDLLNSYGLEY